MSKPGKTKRISPQITITVLPELAEYADQRAEQLGKTFGVRANMSAYIGWLIQQDRARNAKPGGAEPPLELPPLVPDDPLPSGADQKPNG